jgi:hypothetical protein
MAISYPFLLLQDPLSNAENALGLNPQSCSYVL